MQTVVKKELKSPVREKREICFKSENGANKRIAKQRPDEIIAMLRPEKRWLFAMEFLVPGFLPNV